MFNRVDKVAKRFLESVAPYAEKTLTKSSAEKKWEGGWLKNIKNGPKEKNIRSDGTVDWDLYDLVTTINDNWNTIFTFTFPSRSRVGPQANISKLYDLRNIHAHQTLDRRFTSKDVLRFLDNAESFVRAIGDAAAADEIDKIFTEQALELGKMGQMARVKEIEIEFKNAESMRSNPVVYDFIEQEVQRVQSLLPLAFDLKMMTAQLENLTVPIPAVLLVKDVRLALGNLESEQSVIANVNQDEFVKKRNLLLGGLLDNSDRVTFAVRNIRLADATCEITGSQTSYFSSLATHAKMEHELLSTAANLNSERALTVETLRAQLDIRNRFHKAPIEEKRRYGGIGIATQIVYNSGHEGYKVVAGRRRSGTTATGSNLFHVTPSCMFQADKNPRREWNVAHCVIKEYCEELFGLKEDTGKQDPFYIYEEFEPARYLRSALSEGRCELLCSELF